MNSTPKRLGYAPGEVVAPKTGMDSSHGSAMATPAPRRIVRREMGSVDLLVRAGMLFSLPFRGIGTSSVDKLRAGDNGFHQLAEVVAIGGEDGSHAFHCDFVGEHQRTAKSIGEQFAAEVIDEIILAMLADVRSYTFDSQSLSSAGKRGSSIDRTTGQIVRSPF